MTIEEFRTPTSLAEALAVKKEFGAEARVVAGATDLILRMRDRVVSARSLIDLRRLSLDSFVRSDGEMLLGAGLTVAGILDSGELNAEFPALAEACRQFAAPPIRNRATLGGNLVNASPAADLVPPLLAYDAAAVLVSSTGERRVPLSEFFTGPGSTVMHPDEILTGVRVPLTPPATAAVFVKLGHRRSMAISIVNLCVRLTLDTSGAVAVARIALGAVAPTPIRAARAESVLAGREPSADLLNRAAGEAAGETSTISDVRATKDYRVRMTEVLVRRALVSAWKEAGRNASHD